MAKVQLPISKSIANRILMLQAIHGDPLMRVSSDMPDDVIVLHDALEQLRAYGRMSKDERQKTPLTLYLKNCGTALRFLQVHLAQCYPGEPIALDGDERLKERDGKPTSQTTSALILHGIDVPVTPDESPYITMTRKVMEQYPISNIHCPIEACWSSASYWYEYIAIHGGELLLEGLREDSIQGDRIVADIYSEHFGVTTTFTHAGALIKSASETVCQAKPVSIDFSNCPDLYPAVALTCEKLSIELVATGIERLKYKESDRLEAVRLHEVRNDHRIAMALMAADFPVFDEEKKCISKSYPQFLQEFSNASRSHRVRHNTVTVAHVTPVKGVNDDNLGKKHALSKLIHAADAEYVWLHDDDVVLPVSAKRMDDARFQLYDLIILPLRMESDNEKPGLLEKLQMAEYAAIQQLTIESAKKGKAVMCSGANLIVRRETWLACEAELHPELPSGDDMFLLEAMKRHGYKIGVIDEPDYTAVVRPLTSWRAFFKQRMRWAGKAPHYTDKDIRRCGMLVTAANVLQFICPPVLLIKFPLEYRLIKKREPQTSWLVALLLAIFYPLYMLICLIGGLFRKEW